MMEILFVPAGQEWENALEIKDICCRTARKVVIRAESEEKKNIYTIIRIFKQQLQKLALLY